MRLDKSKEWGDKREGNKGGREREKRESEQQQQSSHIARSRKNKVYCSIHDAQEHAQFQVCSVM